MCTTNQPSKKSLALWVAISSSSELVKGTIQNAKQVIPTNPFCLCYTVDHKKESESYWAIQGTRDMYVCVTLALYFCLYNLAVDACASNMLWSAIYGSVEEFPLEQLDHPTWRRTVARRAWSQVITYPCYYIGLINCWPEFHCVPKLFEANVCKSREVTTAIKKSHKAIYTIHFNLQ